MLDNWSRRQKNVSKKFFQNQEGLTLDEVKDKLEPVRDIWYKLYGILSTSGLQLSEYSIIQEFKNINGTYLLLRINYNRIIIISIALGKSLTDEEIADHFDTKEVLDIIGSNKSFKFEHVPEQTALAFIDAYIENKNVYEHGSALNYYVKHFNDQACLSMNIATGGIVLLFHGAKGETNCIFFDGNKPDGMSGELERNTAVEIGNKVKDIRIPESVVDKYMINYESKKLTYGKDK